ncbi:hypothetical protein LTR56_012095 [Elasticomyces elasticus]|nr:hypothetical protein LTR56_012095 [Elasticomyces elasticus]KAK3651845.1 hypothetical protein LTR22_012015 [Elasticomyces elasticus]KAK4930202.1 hypothetical protein LTR49_003236 [Elasticomyces elasticus]KAK5761365.1 hypothetical protein LTS12_008469 [Elasticomyces elasticus]
MPNRKKRGLDEDDRSDNADDPDTVAKPEVARRDRRTPRQRNHNPALVLVPTSSTADGGAPSMGLDDHRRNRARAAALQREPPPTIAPRREGRESAAEPFTPRVPTAPHGGTAPSSPADARRTRRHAQAPAPQEQQPHTPTSRRESRRSAAVPSTSSMPITTNARSFHPMWSHFGHPQRTTGQNSHTAPTAPTSSPAAPAPNPRPHDHARWRVARVWETLRKHIKNGVNRNVNDIGVIYTYLTEIEGVIRRKIGLAHDLSEGNGLLSPDEQSRRIGVSAERRIRSQIRILHVPSPSTYSTLGPVWEYRWLETLVFNFLSAHRLSLYSDHTEGMLHEFFGDMGIEIFEAVADFGIDMLRMGAYHLGSAESAQKKTKLHPRLRFLLRFAPSIPGGDRVVDDAVIRELLTYLRRLIRVPRTPGVDTEHEFSLIREMDSFWLWVDGLAHANQQLRAWKHVVADAMVVIPPKSEEDTDSDGSVVHDEDDIWDRYNKDGIWESDCPSMCDTQASSERSTHESDFNGEDDDSLMEDIGRESRKSRKSCNGTRMAPHHASGVRPRHNPNLTNTQENRGKRKSPPTQVSTPSKRRVVCGVLIPPVQTAQSPSGAPQSHASYGEASSNAPHKEKRAATLLSPSRPRRDPIVPHDVVSRHTRHVAGRMPFHSTIPAHRFDSLVKPHVALLRICERLLLLPEAFHRQPHDTDETRAERYHFHLTDPEWGRSSEYKLANVVAALCRIDGEGVSAEFRTSDDIMAFARDVLGLFNRLSGDTDLQALPETF